MKRRKFLEMTSVGSAALASSIYIPQVIVDRKIKPAYWFGMVRNGRFKSRFKGAPEITGSAT
jgi:hypothetical protein